MIQANNISKIYHVGSQDIYALKQVSFTIEDGEFVVILGPSGAGKSTLLNILGGIDVLDEGEILVNEHALSKKNEQQLCDYRAKEIGFVFQFYNLIPTLTVYENVALMKDIKKDILPVHQILEDVGLKEHKKQFPGQLSGGEQQRVSIARALCKNPFYKTCAALIIRPPLSLPIMRQSPLVEIKSFLFIMVRFLRSSRMNIPWI